jgi:hypothetical protein
VPHLEKPAEAMVMGTLEKVAAVAGGLSAVAGVPSCE